MRLISVLRTDTCENKFRQMKHRKLVGTFIFRGRCRFYSVRDRFVCRFVLNRVVGVLYLFPLGHIDIIGVVVDTVVLFVFIVCSFKNVSLVIHVA